MEGLNLNISALKESIALKLSGAKDDKKSKKQNQKLKKESKAEASNSKSDAKWTQEKGLKKNTNKDSKAKEFKQKDFKAKDSKQKDFKSKDSKLKDSKSNTPKESKPETSVDDILRREALALGATEEDLALVAGLDDDESETEFDASGKDSSLDSDLSKFISELGLPGAPLLVEDEEIEDEVDQDDQVEETNDSSEDGEEEEHPEEEEEEDEEEEEEESEQEEIVPEQKETQNQKEEIDTEMKIHVNPHKDPNASKESKQTKEDTDKVTDFNFVSAGKLILESRVDWYNMKTPREETGEKLDRFAMERLTEKGQTLLDKENKTYLQEFSSINSQKRFLSQILSDGTLNDKISALTLLVQEAPIHNIKAFDTLLGFCEKKSRTAALQAINAMVDLFANGLLPDRKLVAFDKQPLTKATHPKTLALYLFEDHIKKGYFKLIQILELLSHDSILHVKMTVVLHIFTLLKAKPEQEANLLRLGVNKLGDNDNKVAAKTSYQILQLEEVHPAMKTIVTDSVVDMVLQKSTDYHSQYYTILTLNQTILSHKDAELANKLIKAYFSMFEKILVESDPATKEKNEDKSLGQSERGRKNNRKSFKKGKKGGASVKIHEKTESEVVEERSAKMFSALLTGLNRAFPFADLPSEIYLNHLNTLYKITHSTNFNTAVQALVLVQHIVQEQDLDSDRFYRTLYESLMDPRLVNSSKQGIYLNLLFKSMKNDIKNVPRILAFVKRILQVCTSWLNIGAVAGMLYLLMELTKTHPQILDLMEGVEQRTGQDPDGAEREEEYDPKKRNPAFANADKSCMWEITQFLNHYHPTIAIYASSFLDGTPQPKPDLGLYTQSHFLDRFVYKNAKQKENLKGSSIMQPLGGSHTGSLLVRATNLKSEEVPVNTVDWLQKKASEIRPDERFFYDYFISNSHKTKTKKGKDDSKDDDDEEFDEDEVWDALVKLKPDVEGSDDSDLDAADFSDMSDFEEDMGGDIAGGDSEDDAQDLDDGLNSETNEIFSGQEDDEIDSDDSDEDEETQAGSKRALSGTQDEKKKKKTKFLTSPTFASADDYSQYLQSDDEL